MGWNDAAVGRWGAVDAKSAKYAFQTPFNYCTNNPVKMIDPDGMDNIIYILALEGANRESVDEGIKELRKLLKKADLNVQVLEVKDPSKFDASKINKTDAIAVIGGTKEENAKFMEKQLSGVMSERFKKHIEKDGIYRSTPEATNPETTDGWGEEGWSYVTAITTEIHSIEKTPFGTYRYNALEEFGVNSGAELFGLTTLHGLGHLSPDPNRANEWTKAMGHKFGTFMAEGTDLKSSIKNAGGSLSKLVDATKEKSPEIIRNMQQRFQSTSPKLNYNPNE